MAKMETIDNILYEALLKRNKTLKALGYIAEKENIALLLVTYIDELLTGDSSIYVTGKDVKIMNQVLSCIRRNSCLFKNRVVSDDFIIATDRVQGILRSVEVSEEDYMESYDDSIKYRN